MAPQTKKNLDPTILKLKVKEKSFPLKICILSPCLYKSQSSDLLYLKNALLNVLSAINYVANDQDQGNDGEGDQGGVAKVLRVNVVVCVTKFQSSC